MLRDWLKKLIVPAPTSPPPVPAELEFWVRLGHSESRAREIAECFPEHWEKTGAACPQRNARFCLARQLGRIPLHCKLPWYPHYANHQRLGDNDPFAWCECKGYSVCSLQQAIENAVTATRNPRSAQLLPFRRAWDDFRHKRYNAKRKRFGYSENRTPTSPLFWRQLGHNPSHARRLVRCCPEFWFTQTKSSWKSAVRRATSTLRRLAAEFEYRRQHYYELVETDQYDLAKRDPIYWFHQGCDWDEALRKVLKEVFSRLPEGCNRILQVRNRLRKAGRRAELLRDGTIHVSGPALGYQKEYERIQEQRNKRSPEGGNPPAWPRWGPLELDAERAAAAHCCAVGPHAHGTEVLLQILMKSVASRRWLVFDGRSDLLPAIQAVRASGELFLLNPLDSRSCAWDIAEDAASHQQIQEVVAAFLPPDPFTEITLTETAREVLAALMAAFNARAAGRWTLLQIIAALEGPNLRTVLLSDAATAKIYENLSLHPQFRLAISHLQSRLQPLRPAAAAWGHASTAVSIASWVQSQSVLVLANSFAYQHFLLPINRILFQLAASRLMNRQPDPPVRTWLFLSDLCQIGRLESLTTLLSQGPAFGLTVAITLEDVEILQRHYGAETTGVLGLCGNFAFLRITNPVTARWASQLIGIEKVRQVYRTEGTLSGKTSRGVTVTAAERPLVPPTALQQLSLPQAGHGPVGYFQNLNRRIYRGQVDLNRVINNQWLTESKLDQPALIPRPEEHFQFPQDTASILSQIGSEATCTSSRALHRKSKTSKRGKPATKTTPDGTQHQPAEFDPNEFPRIELPPD